MENSRCEVLGCTNQPVVGYVRLENIKYHVCQYHVNAGIGMIRSRECSNYRVCDYGDCIGGGTELLFKNGQFWCPQHAESKAVRSTDADGERYDLISPIALKALAETYAEGARKYGAFNCERGFPVTGLLNHAIRHIYMFLAGDRSEPHLAHAAWNVMFAVHSFEKWPELNKDLRGPDCTIPDQS